MSSQKQRQQWIRPLPGWYGANIHAEGKISVYSETAHTIVTLPFTEDMKVGDLKLGLFRLFSRPPTHNLRLYNGDQLLEDDQLLSHVHCSAESLLRMELLSEESTSDSFLSDLEETRRIHRKKAKSEAPKTTSLDVSSCTRGVREVEERIDFSTFAVPDLELKATKTRKRK